ncbi:M15 family metallopeptidase [Terrabacter sp. GCM10028922]|uniref:M15 family metallopeptidase n=1 Tax=Terrabacter sp. GCM10028922 TaxID=3273428 RepID=UPI00361CF3E3
MSSFQPASAARRHPRSALLALLGVVAVLVSVLGCRPPGDASTEAPRSVAEPAERASYDRLRGDVSLHPPGELPGDTPGGLGAADGHLPDGVSAFDDRYPAVTNLDPALLGALRGAASDAADDGVTLHVNSGWRSSAYQEQLLHEAVTKYGTSAETARWVATPATSPHVSGEAVDIGDLDATTWLSEHGARYGLCQIYANESWHFELRRHAVDRGCPAMYADPSHDPRMQE